MYPDCGYGGQVLPLLRAVEGWEAVRSEVAVRAIRASGAARGDVSWDGAMIVRGGASHVHDSGVRGGSRDT